MRKCAVCWNDIGWIASLWICPSCKNHPANQDWKAPSSLEATGFDMDVFAAGTAIDMTPRRDPYAGDLAIRIMALHCARKSNRAIARELECRSSYVDRTVAYWKKNRGEKLKTIKKIARLIRKGAH